MTIYPSILCETPEMVQQQLDLVAGHVPTVQIDIVDGVFADDVTITPSDMKNLDFHGMMVDFHLLVEEPEDYLLECESVQPVRSVIGQIEHMSSQDSFVEEVQKRKWKAGLSVDVYTPFSSLDPHVFGKLAIAQIMMIRSGAQGRPFQHSALPKIAEAAKVSRQHAYGWEILADGGVDSETAPLCQRSGATGFAVGSSLWETENLDAMLDTLRMV